MLKKAGIITAVAVAGAIALTPFAFAHGSQEAAPTDHTNIEKGNLGNDCEFAQAGGDITAPATGGDALVGAGGLVANAVAPVTAPIQALNCTNIGVSDVIDNNSNNDTRTATQTEVDDSNNTTSD